MGYVIRGQKSLGASLAYSTSWRCFGFGLHGPCGSVLLLLFFLFLLGFLPLQLKGFLNLLSEILRIIIISFHVLEDLWRDKLEMKDEQNYQIEGQ